MRMTTCSRQKQLCTDCSNKNCQHAGDKGSDCPKYTCDNETPMDCNHCSFIEQYLRIMRNELRKEA